MDEKSIKSKTNIYEASCHSSQKKKSSVAIIQLPQEGPFMAVADKMEQSGQDERTNITNDIDHVENTESITITQKDINQTNDAKAVCNIAEVLPDNSSNHSYEITSKETDPGPSKEAVFHVFMHKVPLKRKRAIKKRKTSELSKAGSPVPLRNYITYNPTQINNDGDKQSLIKHLKSATELLKKRRRATCDFANKAFEDLRLSIETRFHLLLSQRQERWNHLNNIYKQKLNDISKGIECDFRIPSIHEVAHQDSNDVNYILQQNSESG
ncbi:hypothetical protein BBOV_II003442 [Babesia bovis T2Bo]|uniref:hypothetical protein n=1 Tax=Babesia bovis T2Bo TaxID=484906 RepID=UPI001C358331|nr:hypothetical protein BBOV_II003442 [Babesia bovis T2Bo]KAG6440130.1 hypothetical protein BBOV_II003442 [Babesia bovis T2Bo]